MHNSGRGYALGRGRGRGVGFAPPPPPYHLGAPPQYPPPLAVPAAVLPPLPCLALRSYVLDGTRTKLPTPVHILAHPAGLPELSRKVTFVSRSSHRNIQKMSLEKGVTCFIWFMYLDGKNEQNILFLKMIQIRTNNTRSQSIADPRESGGAAK